MESPSRNGLSTWLALILTVLTSLAAVIGELADASAPLGVQPKVWVMVSAVIAVALILGKQLQGALVGAAQARNVPQDGTDTPPTQG